MLDQTRMTDLNAFSEFANIKIDKLENVPMRVVIPAFIVSELKTAFQIGFMLFLCGACCAYFRVSFYWAEAKKGGGTVPDAMTEQVTPFISCMSGTNSKSPRCSACRAKSVTLFPVQFIVTAHPPAMNLNGQEMPGFIIRTVIAPARYGLPPLPIDNFEVIRLEEITARLMTGSHSAP